MQDEVERLPWSALRDDDLTWLEEAILSDSRDRRDLLSRAAGKDGYLRDELFVRHQRTSPMVERHLRVWRPPSLQQTCRDGCGTIDQVIAPPASMVPPGGTVAQQARRKNDSLLNVIRAIAVGASIWLGLFAMHVRPTWLSVAVALLAGVLTLATAELGVLLAVVVLSMPIMAVQPVMGLAALILGVVSVRYLGSDGGRAFLVVALSVVGAFFGPVWAGAALAGYLLGAGEGALAAAVACVIIECIGVGLGKPSIGVLLTGGAPNALLSFEHMPTTLLSVQWIRESFGSMGADSVNQVVSAIAGVTQPAALAIQPALWALGAIVAGTVGAESRRRHNLLLGLGAVAAGVIVPALGTIAIYAVLGTAQPWVALSIAAASSLAVAVAFVAIWEKAFTLVPDVPPPAATRRISMASEDADVDELLRLIATAEDKLASQHTTTKIVIITDMKSFSRMTEEDGSVVTAKAIQRHRDLLIPIITSNGGKGKSTGGDGLVAAFDTATSAVTAACEMQHALAEHNSAHASEREIWVRMGLASGEVVLDNGGRPFIGAALNLAARVMNLADGGQIFSTGDVAGASESTAAQTHSFGPFELKNIAKPVELVEILWEAGQAPHDPREQEPPEE